MARPRLSNTLEEAVSSKAQRLPVRRCSNWIDSFNKYTENLISPPIFKQWGAIAALAAVMERKTWCYLPRYRSNLYPNMYIVLVAPAGVGKGVLLDPVRALLSEVPEHHLSPNSMSGASLVDALAMSERKIIRPQDTPSIITYNSMTLFVTEFGVLLPSWDRVVLNNLTDLYDCKSFRDKKRGKDLDIEMANPQLNLFTATTPSYLKDTLPDTAWDHGFMSRTILIYNGELDTGDIFEDDFMHEQEDDLFKDLVADLKEINKAYGKFSFTEEAMKSVRDWLSRGQKPVPEHPKLVSYLSRRTTQVVKLSMIHSIAESNNLVIEVEHFDRALQQLLDAEAEFPNIFKAMRSTGGDAGAMRELYHFMYDTFMKDREKKPLPHGVLEEFLWDHVPVHSITRIIESMVTAGVIEEVHMPLTKQKYYKPKTPQKIQD